MVDQKKIIIMTKLALYEKKHMAKDQRKLKYFVEDYIYINNFLTRLGVTLIMAFNIAVGSFKIINCNIIFPTSTWEFWDVYIRPYVLPWLLLIIIYTIISTAVSGRAYSKANTRFNEYKKLMKELDKYESHRANNEGAGDEI